MKKQIRKVKITTGYVCNLFAVSKSTVLHWIKEGLLKGHRLPGGHFRIEEDDLRAFAKKFNLPLNLE